jgi:hypothetical protein
MVFRAIPLHHAYFMGYACTLGSKPGMNTIVPLIIVLEFITALYVWNIAMDVRG